MDREYTMIPFCDSKDAGRMGVGGGGERTSTSRYTCVKLGCLSLSLLVALFVFFLLCFLFPARHADTLPRMNDAAGINDDE